MGSFERYIENILVAYLENLCSILPIYSTLPKTIQDNNPILSAQLISNLKLLKYSNENIEEIVSKLNKCLRHDISELNTIAFTDHNSNFRNLINIGVLSTNRYWRPTT